MRSSRKLKLDGSTATPTFNRRLALRRHRGGLRRHDGRSRCSSARRRLLKATIAVAPLTSTILIGHRRRHRWHPRASHRRCALRGVHARLHFWMKQRGRGSPSSCWRRTSSPRRPPPPSRSARGWRSIGARRPTRSARWLFCERASTAPTGALWFWSYVYYLSKYYELLDRCCSSSSGLDSPPCVLLHLYLPRRRRC